MRLSPVGITKAHADEFVDRLHRHHDSDQGHRFSLGCWDLSRDVLCGVAVVGNPRAPVLAKLRRVVEVTRCCTDGTRDACSWLYTRAAERARIDGFAAIITYTLASEGGASLRAAGWWGEKLPPSLATWANRPGRDADHVRADMRWLKMLSNDWREVPALSADVRQSVFVAFSLDMIGGAP